MAEEPRGGAEPAGDPSADVQEDSTQTQATPRLPTAIPKMIGQFHVKRLLASGGMGTVYEAVQEHPRRAVTLKVMKRGVASRSAMRRFEYESQLLARLHHPGIAQVYEAGMHEDPGAPGEPVPFFAMEYIPNARPITEFAEKKKLGIGRRLELFAHVCEAVHHGHQKGIIHRDLKPGNILVDSHGEVKIIDFGVARGTDSDLAVTTVQTDIGQLIGTLQYMSPEQCEADPHDIDTRSDVYALGVVLYELLAGKLPYDVKKKPVYETTRVIREQQPSRLSTGDTTLKGDIETIVLKALEKDRDRRYQSTIELAQDVRRYLGGEAIIARPPSIIYQLRVFARRNKALFGAIAGVFIVLVAGVIATTSMYIGAQRQAAKAEATLDFLGGMLRTVDPTEARGRELTVRSILDEAARRIAAGALADQPLVEASVRTTIGRTYMSLALHDTAEPHLLTALAIRRRTLGDEHRDTLQSACFHAEVLWKQRDFEAAESLMRQTLETQRRVLGPEDHDTIYSMNRLAAVLWDHGKRAEAEGLYSSGLKLARRVLGEEHQTTLMLMGNLALLYHDRGESAKAEQLDRRCLELRRRVLGREHPHTLLSMNNLAVKLRALGKVTEAEELGREALAICRRVMGEEHPDTLRATWNLAGTLLAQDRLTEAEELARRAVDGYRRVLGDVHPDTVGSMRTLTPILYYRSRLTDAESLHRRSLEVLRRDLGEDDPLTLEASAQLAYTFWHQGRIDEAAQLLSEVFEATRRTLGENDQNTLYVMWRLGQALVHQGKLSEAEDLFRRAHELCRHVHGEGEVFTLEVGWELAKVLCYRGHATEARPLVNRFLAENRSRAQREHLAASDLNDTAWDLLIRECQPVDPGDLETALRLTQSWLTASGGDSPLGFDTLALVQKMTGNLDKAVESQRQALAGLSTEESYFRSQFVTRLIGYHRESGDHQAADSLFRNALAAVRQTHGEKHTKLVRRMTDLALLLLAQGRRSVHDVFCAQLTQVRRGIVPQGEPGIANLVVIYAETLMKRGEHAEAEELLRHCLDIRELAHGDTDWRTAHVMSLLGVSLTGRGNFDEAERLLLDAYSQMSDNADRMPEEYRDDRIREARERIVSLYESWNRPDQAAKYRAMLENGE